MQLKGCQADSLIYTLSGIIALSIMHVTLVLGWAESIFTYFLYSEELQFLDQDSKHSLRELFSYCICYTHLTKLLKLAFTSSSMYGKHWGSFLKYRYICDEYPELGQELSWE